MTRNTYMPCKRCNTWKLANLHYKMEDFVHNVLVFAFTCLSCNTKQKAKYALK